MKARLSLKWLLGAALLGLLAAAAGYKIYQGIRAHLHTGAVYQQYGVDPGNLPYPEHADPRADLAVAQRRAAAQDKLVMVIFGANWCPDCLALNAALQSDVVSAYAQRNFEVVKVDVGQFDRNQDFAEQLGVTSRRGIPVAVFLDRDGQLIGVTNDGELEPARAYTSRQILAFIQEVAANRQIVRP